MIPEKDKKIIDELLKTPYYSSGAKLDSIRAAGEKDGCRYYHLSTKRLWGHKLGWPHIVKIDKDDKAHRVDDTNEIMWAQHQAIVSNSEVFPI